ncbi:MAG TPA: DUF4232 domain-containing protein [Streptosporangiaceae bacterium]
MKRFFAVALSATAVVAVIIALQFAPRGRAAPVRASGSHHPIKLRNWVPPKHRRYPMWVVPAHSGAVATTSATSAAPCAASALTTAYWTSFPAMTTVISGFNVTNSGSLACTLPRFPGAISLASANGATVKLARLTRQGADFADFRASAASVAQPAKLAGPALGLTLRPGGTAAVLLYTFSSLDDNPHMACISAPRNGFLDVRLAGAQKLAVKVPSDAQPATVANPTSSALTSCGVVTVSAFLTWKVAKSLVGVPVPESAVTGAVPLVPRFKAIFAAAP